MRKPSFWATNSMNVQNIIWGFPNLMKYSPHSHQYTYDQMFRTLIRRSFFATQPPHSPSSLLLLCLSASNLHPAPPFTISHIFTNLICNGFITPTNFPDLASALSTVSSLHLERDEIDYLHEMMADSLPWLPDRDLWQCSLLLCKVDPYFHESMMYQHILKFYLESKYELMRSQLKINYKSSLWEMMKHLFSRLLVMKYGSRTTKYRKSVDLPDSLRKPVLLSLMSNHHIRDSLLIAKIHNQIFVEIKRFYEDRMKENLYHREGGTLMRLISDKMGVFCLQNPLFNSENSLIRELYLKLLIARKQNGGDIDCNIADTIPLYLFVKERYENSEERTEYLCLMSEEIRSLKPESVSEGRFRWEYLELLTTGDALWEERTVSSVVQVLLSHPTYDTSVFQKILSSFENHQQFRIQMIKAFKNLIEKLTLPQLLQLLNLCRDKHVQAESILQQIINLQHFELTQPDILQLLVLLGEHSSLPSRKTIRDFLFKYISDHYSSFSPETQQKIKEMVLTHKDSQEPFDDSGLYKSTIFEEMDGMPSL